MTSFQYYAEEVKRVYGTSFPNAAGTYGSGYHIVERRPMGVSVGHLAWNYPLGNAGLKIAPAVVSGCCCIIKPSSQTPLATLYLGVIAEKIGFPAGVINIISGPAAEVGKDAQLQQHPEAHYAHRFERDGPADHARGCDIRKEVFLRAGRQRTGHRDAGRGSGRGCGEYRGEEDRLRGPDVREL